MAQAADAGFKFRRRTRHSHVRTRGLPAESGHGEGGHSSIEEDHPMLAIVRQFRGALGHLEPVQRVGDDVA
jgi:hypothetical protein